MIKNISELQKIFECRFRTAIPHGVAGCFYVKPNFPGRCSHVANGGFIVRCRHLCILGEGWCCLMLCIKYYIWEADYLINV